MRVVEVVCMLVVVVGCVYTSEWCDKSRNAMNYTLDQCTEKAHLYGINFSFFTCTY